MSEKDFLDFDRSRTIQNPESMSTRLASLEACRGVAAIIVLVQHFFLAFAPQLTGILPSHRTEFSAIGHWYFFIFNGNGAVYFFFVLSGFVLTWSFFNKNDPSILVKSALRRLPRLAGLTTVVTLVSCSLFVAGAYRHEEAAVLTNSPWLATFGHAGLASDFHPNWLKAFAQGTLTFITGVVHYNSNMWTMRVELQGSLLSFAMALFVFTTKGLWARIYLLALCLVVSHYFGMYMFSFALGTCLSFLFSTNNFTSRPFAALAMLIAGLYLLGYTDAIGHYAWLPGANSIAHLHTMQIVNSIGAALIISSAVTNPWIDRCLSGKHLSFLGRISFPIYLVHTLVIFSFSSWLYAALTDMGIHRNDNLFIVFIATIVTSVAGSIPLMKFDQFWIKLVDRLLQPMLAQQTRRG